MSRTSPSLTPAQQQAVLTGYATMGARALALQFGVPLYVVKNLVYRHRLKRDPASTLRRAFTAQERATIAARYADTPTAVLATELQRTVWAVYRMATKLGLKKSAAFLATEASGRLQQGSTVGVATRIAKGTVSHNKGKKMPAHVYAKVQRTMFKKGQLPHNTKHDGYVSVRRDTDGRQYFFIRTALGVHVHLHRKLWTDAHGPVKQGHVIAFKDGNQGNCVLENLEEITLAERFRRSSIANYPKDIREAIRALALLNKRIKKHGTEQA